MHTRNSHSRNQRSLQELHRASLAVRFEVVTLWVSHIKLQQVAAHWGSTDDVQFSNNVLLHSFLLAARNLLTFLFSHKPRPTDIIAEDFFDDPNTWKQGRLIPDPAIENGELIGQISKRLTHLTWNRAEANKSLWGCFWIAWNIGKTLQSFLAKVDHKNIDSQLREDIEAGMKELQLERDRDGGENVITAPALEFFEFDEIKYFQKLRQNREH